MTRVCEKCGKEFEGLKTSHYCKHCRLEIQRKAAREYYYKHREEIRKKQKEYQAQLPVGKKTREHAKYETVGWKVEYIRHGDLWTWKATRGKVVLKAARDFSSITIAQRDCLLAIG